MARNKKESTYEGNLDKVRKKYINRTVWPKREDHQEIRTETEKCSH